MKHKISPDRRTLTIVADKRDRTLLRQIENVQSDAAVLDFFEPLAANSELDWVLPHDTGDLTDAPMLGILGEERTGNKLQPGGPFGNVPNGLGSYLPILERWGFMDYQLRSPLEDLRDKGEAVFINGQ